MNRLPRILAALVFAAGLSSVAATPAHADTYPCVGAPATDPNGGLYAEPRIYLEPQSWWRTTPGETGPDQGHGHFGGCVPAGQTVTGPVEFNFLTQLHANPGYAKRLYQKVSTDTCATCGEVLQFYNADPAQFSCAAGVVTCQFWLHTTFDPCAATDRDGWQAVKSRLEIKEPDGNTMRPSLQFMADLSCGKPVDDYNRALTDGYGWQTDANYAYAKFHSYAPTYIPPATVSGQWTVNLSFMPTTDGISLNVAHYLISVDPAFHAVPPSPGVVFYDAATGCAPKVKTNCGTVQQNFTIDTTVLANGPHRLFLRADSPDPRGSTLSGVLVIPINVAN